MLCAQRQRKIIFTEELDDIVCIIFYSYLDWSNSLLDWFHLLLLVRLKQVRETTNPTIKNFMNMLISLYESFCNTAVRKFLFSHSFQQNRRNTHSRGFHLFWVGAMVQHRGELPTPFCDCSASLRSYFEFNSFFKHRNLS